MFHLQNRQPALCLLASAHPPKKDVSHDLPSDVLEVAAVQVLRKSRIFHDFSMEGNRGAKESLEFGISDVINIYIYKYLSKPFKWRLKLKKSIENGGGEISL